MCSIIGSANIELAASSDFFQILPYLLHFQCLNANMEFVENKHLLSIDHRVQADPDEIKASLPKQTMEIL